MSVILYEENNFRGRHKHINGRSEANLHADGWGDRVSSIQIVAGSWEFWEKANFQGRQVILGPGSYPVVGDGGISNDSLSSVQRRGSFPGLMRTPGLIVYKQADFRGDHKHIIDRDEPDLHVDGWDNQVSSIQIISGLWRFCQHANYGGWSAVLGPGNYPQVGAVGIANDQLSSIKHETTMPQINAMPTRELILYEQIDFQGDHKHLINRGEQDLHDDGWGDRGSSLQIISGTRWTLHEGIYYTGAKVNPPQESHRQIQDIGMGNSRISSIRANIIPVFFKIIQGASANIDRDLVAANRVYNQYGFELFALGQDTVNVPVLLDLEQPGCDPGQVLTSEEDQLFNLGRDHAPADIIVYYLRSTSFDVRGCAAFPANRPGCVVTDAAIQWTLAHELGHMLELGHVVEAQLTNNLMFSPTTDITTDPPLLTEVQQKTVRASRFLV